LQRAVLAIAVTSGLLGAGWIALADRGEAHSRVDVSSSVLPDHTVPTGRVTSTSEPAPPTTEAVPGDKSITGNYVGVEHFALFTGRCSFLDHHLAAMFVDSTGASWQFHQDYCGTLHDGDLWSGVGTFALTAADGAAITGTVTETDIVVPSPGVPYTIVITGGTQRFAGAAGSCRMDNHLHQIEFGLQDDFGSFVCNLSA
jgi:hypothetical protein